ncbi:MAG: Radical SAM domain protein [Cytophagales bacterium]|jgi:anaerobic magnesium-protoporphyrin IX monomethyl ester cyclase|nr:B12-binding domain-containing radical SAM protein [Bacteroidota bacterium]WHZ08998.1 MAG: Radical SAM domain protein [Cytophagales bacterium]
MVKILLTHSYFYKLDSKQWKFKQPYPPLGTIQAASVIRQKYDVSFYDVALKDNPQEIISLLQREKPSYFVIYDDGFNYLTKMCLIVMREAAFTMIKLAKQFGCVVIISSSDATDHYEKYFLCGADYIIRGEGEKTLVGLLDTLENKKDVSAVNGLVYRKNNVSLSTPSQKVLNDLDQLPFPAWDLIDMESYRAIWIKHHGYFSLNIATTRGCPYKCNWCAKPIYGNRYNYKSVNYVIREIELLLSQYKPDHFWMCDDIFGLKPGWIQEFDYKVATKNLSFHYKIQSRADLLVKKDIVRSLAASGCETVWLGAESGSQKILNAMDKGITVEQIHQARQLLKQHHIRAGFFLQFGYLNETRHDIDETLKMVFHLIPDEIGISVSYPLPGTKFYDRVKNELKGKQNWNDSDDLAMMYKSTYSPAYYKILHRYVHSRYRIQCGWVQIKSWRMFSIRECASLIYHLTISVIRFYQLQKLSHASG